METTSGDEVVAFIAAAAGTGVDVHHMEVGVQETEEPATKKQRSQLESQHTELDVSKKDLELLERHLQCIHSSCVRCSNETVVRALRINALIQSQVWEPFLPSGRTFRLIEQSRFILPTALNTSFLLSLMKVVI